jgi:CAI-1 autoinducer synthase
VHNVHANVHNVHANVHNVHAFTTVPSDRWQIGGNGNRCASSGAGGGVPLLADCQHCAEEPVGVSSPPRRCTLRGRSSAGRGPTARLPSGRCRLASSNEDVLMATDAHDGAGARFARGPAPATCTHADIDNRIARWFAVRAREWPLGQHPLKSPRAPAAGDVVMMSNDYLCLAGRPEVLRARRWTGTRTQDALIMSAVFLGDDSEQGEFEARIADFTRADAAVVCQSGFAANVGLLQAIAERSDNVFVDQYAHMSMYEGVAAAGARARRFRHNDPGDLEARLRRFGGGGFVLVDSVYSTSGEVAPLRDLADVAARHGCGLIVDESHSLGTHGPQGRGLVVELGLESAVLARTASLAKAFAARAGVIVGSPRLREAVRYRSRPAIFSSALLPFEVAVLDATLTQIARADERRRQLFENAAYLRRGLVALGLDFGTASEQILGLVGGPEARTIHLRNALESRGVFGSVFCAPATPPLGSLIRLTVNSGLARADLDRVVAACGEVLAREPDLFTAMRRAPRAATEDAPALVQAAG